MKTHHNINIKEEENTTSPDIMRKKMKILMSFGPGKIEFCYYGVEMEKLGFSVNNAFGDGVL